MRVGDSDSGLKRVSEYSMGNKKLEYCDTERDLGVIMSTDLKVESQCNEACHPVCLQTLQVSSQQMSSVSDDICCEDT